MTPRSVHSNTSKITLLPTKTWNSSFSWRHLMSLEGVNGDYSHLASGFWSIHPFLPKDVSIFLIPVCSFCWLHVFLCLPLLLFRILFASYTLLSSLLSPILLIFCKCELLAWPLFFALVSSSPMNVSKFSFYII